MPETNPLQDAFLRLQQAEELRQRKELDGAQSICEMLLRQHPDYVAVLHTLGLVLADKGNYEQALNYLVRAAMFNPGSWLTLTALGSVYLNLGAPQMAAQVLEEAKVIRPEDPDILVTLGEVYREEREYELAQSAYHRALKLNPNLEPAITGLGWVCSYLGQNAEAVALFEGLAKRGLSSFDSLLALTSLPGSLITIDLLTEIDKLIRDKNEEEAAFQNSVAFVRAKALAILGRHAEAWQLLAPANRMCFLGNEKELREEKERARVILDALRTNPIKVADASNDDRVPISLFILGPSRSGKTTMEALVATLPGVKRGYENPCVENAIQRTFRTAGLPTSRYFEFLPHQLYPLCHEIYLEELRRRASSVQVFTNTHPARIYDASLIATVFPNVRFIFIKRNLEDLILRMYQVKYQRGHIYSYDLKASRDHAIWYYQIMDRLAQQLPGIVCIVRYEDMVVDPNGALRAAAKLCGLPMHNSAIPQLGDDRGCAEPYRQFMAAEIER